MIQKIQYLITEEKNPYRNLALEENLLEAVDTKTCILYMWQNENAVVVGKNQNIWQECRVKELIMNGGYPARRISGGGAVYHDLGNLNFTFLMQAENFDREKQSQVLLDALKRLGIHAKRSGRNDIVSEGKKISGSAFYYEGLKCCHHGTILLNTDKEKIERYLTVSREKLMSKGVDSVKSRVANLCDFVPNLAIPRLRKALLYSFGKTYGLEPEEFRAGSLDASLIQKSYEKFASWDWIYGRKITFRDGLKRRFDWGNMEIYMDVKGGVIERCEVFSDALDPELPELVAGVLRGCRFESREAVKRMKRLEELRPNFPQVTHDLCRMMEDIS